MTPESRGGGAAPASGRREQDSPGSGSADINAEIEERFGLLPNFFRLTSVAPAINASLWGFARFAYLDNPLPSLFKERLFVYISRFCEVRYCVARHVGFLIGLGRPAGDPRAPAQTIEHALRLLRRELPRGSDLEPQLARLGGEPFTAFPPPESRQEEALLTCAAHVYLQSPDAPRCVSVLTRVLGEAQAEYLLVFLTFVRTAHYWTLVHDELMMEPDLEELLAAHEALAECLLDDAEAGTCDLSERVFEELQELRLLRSRAAAGESEAAAGGALRRGDAALAAHVAEARDARRAALNMMEDAIEARDALRESQQRLLEADRRKDEFLATLAHELRNPLAPIHNSLQVMRLAGMDGKVTEQARETIERQVNHLIRLVDDLLDVSRISRNKFVLRKKLVALSVIIQTAVETSRPKIQEAGQELTVELPPQAVWVHADLTRMGQAVANLLNNAAKYTARDGRIGLTAGEEDGEAVIRISDTGVGIPSEMLPHIFEMFTQVDTSHERSHGGLGIGLTLVKNLVEMHGGTVEAHSAGPGTGAEFVLRLPIAKEQPKAATPRIGGGPTAAPRRILVVDDNRDSADSLATLLAQAGHKTQTAYDGLAGMESAASFRPEVILLDIGMPKLNGYEVARRVRRESWGRSILLCALTGWGQDDDRAKSKAAGFDAHLVKPVDQAELNKVLAAHRI